MRSICNIGAKQWHVSFSLTNKDQTSNIDTVDCLGSVMLLNIENLKFWFKCEHDINILIIEVSILIHRLKVSSLSPI